MSSGEHKLGNMDKRLGISVLYFIPLHTPQGLPTFPTLGGMVVDEKIFVDLSRVSQSKKVVILHR